MISIPTVLLTVVVAGLSLFSALSFAQGQNPSRNVPVKTPAPPAMTAIDDDLISLSVESTSKLESSFEAGREMISRAMADFARMQAAEILGERATGKLKTQVENRIVRDSAKFIPFVNPSPVAQNSDGTFRMTIDMKLSASSLRKLMLAAGLLQSEQGPAVILPMITWLDRPHAVSFRWWQDDRDDSRKFLVQLHEQLEAALATELLRQGFFLMRPQPSSGRFWLPEALRSERHTAAELKQLGAYLETPMLLRGEVRLREGSRPNSWQAQYKLVLIQTQGARTLAEVTRTFDSDPGTFEQALRSRLQIASSEVAKDLAGQIAEAWSRGTVSANKVQVTVTGGFTPKQLLDFKANLLRSVKDIRSFRERLFEPGRVTFEADFTGDTKSLIEKMSALQVPGVALRVNEAGANKISVEAKVLR